MNLRARFADIVNGWMVVGDFDELTDRIARAAEWTKENGPLNADEQAIVSLWLTLPLRAGATKWGVLRRAIEGWAVAR